MLFMHPGEDKHMLAASLNTNKQHKVQPVTL